MSLHLYVTWRLLRGVRRNFELAERLGGRDLRVPGGRAFGFARFNVRGRHAGSLRVYPYDRFFRQHRHDPRRLFTNNSPSNRGRGWTCLVDPDDEGKMRYVIGVLEGCYDRAR